MAPWTLPDYLTTPDRDFYESTLLKYVLSIICGAFCLFFLGMTATSGSIASAERTMKAMPHEGDDSVYQTAVGGFGFSTFCYFIAFTLSLAAAIIISPGMTGSRGEYRNLKSPGDFKFQKI